MGVNGNKLADVMNNTAQVKCDRLYDRIFDNSKLLSTIDGDFSFTPMSVGLRQCLQEFIKKPHWTGEAVRKLRLPPPPFVAKGLPSLQGESLV